MHWGHWGHTAAKKKESGYVKQRTSNKKSSAILTVIGTATGRFFLDSSKSSEGVQKELPTPLHNYFRSTILKLVLFFLFGFS